MAKTRKKTAAAHSQSQVAVQPSPPLSERLESLLGQRSLAIVVALILLASVRIAVTYTVFNHTSDEPAHIACGMQWLDQGIYQYEAQHPPLTRVMVALGPYLSGARSNHQQDMTIEGNTLLYGDGHYDLRLALSRAGNLPFFWLACWMVFLWGRRILDTAGAVLSVLIFTMTPTVLAHAGLATTDIGVTACFAAATYASVRFLEQPDLKRTVWLGVAMGLMVITKFSALAFYPASAIAALACWLYASRPSLSKTARLLAARIPWIGVAALLSLLVIWAGYRFSFGKTVWIPFSVPFPELYSGVKEVMNHNATGHPSYFLGELRRGGWWDYFPLLIAIKLPLGLLVLALVGLWRRPARPGGAWPFALAVAIPVGILAVAMSSRINIGLRHILPALPFFAIIAAAGTLWLIQESSHTKWTLWVAAAAVSWMVIGSLAAHPDYLAYFNAFAGDEPERIVVDSDLDWGQDIKRLGKRLQELNAPSVAFTPTITISLAALGFPPHQQNDADAPAPGWNAVQVTHWKLNRIGLAMNDHGQTWPDVVKPTERVGRSILLYYVPPQAPAGR
ncbi:MAG TPA: glycosyltransferase family 39 protein [Bryobacteraceae bacterium]|nr:glycosyltransferase family 39 protein [Bryobacteraceae bacterium]